MTVDRRGSLWMRLGSARVARQVDRRFEIVSSLERTDDAITAIAVTREGTVLVAGIVEGLLRWNGEGFDALASRAELPPRSPVTSISEGADGRIWMGTHDAGLFYLAQGRVTAVRQGLPDPSITALVPVGANGLWVATSKGIVR
jgi:ligand-binding sensor domain-containing protein